MSDQQKQFNEGDDLDKFIDDILAQDKAADTPAARRNITQMVIRPLTVNEFSAVYTCAIVTHALLHGDRAEALECLALAVKHGVGPEVCNMTKLMDRMAKSAMQG